MILNYFRETHLKNCFGVLSTIATGIAIFCIASPTWSKTEVTKKVIGIFPDHCPSIMSELECGYFQSSKVSSVVSIIFGGVSSAMYFFPPYEFGKLRTFIAISGNLCQLVFGVLTIVFFYYFTIGYFEDDGINNEFNDVDPGDLTLRYCYYLWCGSCGLVFALVIAGYGLLYRKYLQDKKSELGLGSYSRLDSSAEHVQ